MRCHRSLSLKSNASQDKILFELEQLKYSFKEALRLSLRPTGRRTFCEGDNADARVSRNLHKLAAAARQFHSAASSTSGTTRDGSNVSWRALSLIGDFPEHKQQRVKEFINHQLHYPPAVSVVSDQHDPPRSNSPAPTLGTISSLGAGTPAIVITPTVPEPPQAESDDEEDDEAEDEQEYFDGLEELAKDRIVNGNYTKAIDFLTQAMAREAGTKSTGNEFRELQIQLALCHFFQGDWKKAEPIVTSLSKLLDVVTCNLLHALALFHLFEYSFDDALKTCRKSLAGKKKLLKNNQAGYGEYAESDYAETVALRATIHHMSGDPIHAEIYHRRLPHGFEYKHPTRAIDFILKHPLVLSIALGQHVPASSACALGLPGDAQGLSPTGPTGSPTVEFLSGELRRKVTVSASPLRTRFAFFERYENDTSKFVVEGSSPCSPADPGTDEDADDESSPVGIPSEGAPPLLEPEPASRPVLKRRVTRYFTSRRPRQRATDEDAEAGVTTHPQTSVLPPSRWNKLGFSKPKGLLRKNSNGKESEAGSPAMTKRARTLRLGNMEVTLRTRAFAAQPLQEIVDSNVAAPQALNLKKYAATSGGWRFDPSNEPVWRRHSLVALVESTGADVLPPSRDLDLSTNEARESAAGPAESSRLPGSATPWCELYAPPPLCELGNTEVRKLCAMPVPPDDRIKEHIHAQLEALRACSSEEESLTPGTGIEECEQAERLTGPRKSQRQVPLLTITTTTNTAPSQMHASADLAGLLGRAAAAVGSLAYATDSQKRLAVRLELETILGLLDGGISNDPVLACDLRRIVASLDKGREPASPDGASDSGYETGDPPHEAQQAPTPPQPAEQRSGPPAASPDDGQAARPLDDSGATSPRTETPASCDAAPRPALPRSMPSFVAGDDAKFTVRRWREHREEPDVPELHRSSPEDSGSPAGEVLPAEQPDTQGRCEGDGEGDGEGGSLAPDLSRAFSFIAEEGDRPTCPVESLEQLSVAVEADEGKMEGVVSIPGKRGLLRVLAPYLPGWAESGGESEVYIKEARARPKHVKMSVPRFSLRVKKSI